MTDYFLDLESLPANSAVLRWNTATEGPRWLCFRDPIDILVAESADEVESVVCRAEAHRDAGGWSVGFLSYEAAPGLNPKLTVKDSYGFPLAWFALYAEPTSHRELRGTSGQTGISLGKPHFSREDYADAFDKVKLALEEGASYQINLTFAHPIEIDSSAAQFFASRCGTHPPEFASFIRSDEWSIASFSPELFYERVGDKITMRPMKGTALISAPVDSLSQDPKSVAENIMIVDMVRNDLGMVCEPGSIEVPHLLSIERHGRLLQMTSTVEAKCTRSTRDILAATFPAASITGAPKVSTMRLLSEIEAEPRGIYCGAIGCLAPNQDRFSVAIRTTVLRGNQGTYGIGSGVVWDSDLDAEYDECLAKLDPLFGPSKPWALLETLSTDDLDRIDAHLDRLVKAASQLGVPLDRERARDAILSKVHDPRQRTRLLVDETGQMTTQRVPIVERRTPLRVRFADRPIAQDDPNLRIKTTSRQVYEAFLDQYADVDEVLLWTKDGYATEFCNGALLAKIEGEWLTPDPSDGLLDSIEAKLLVERGLVRYARITKEAVLTAEAIEFANSVTGRLPVVLV